MKLRGFVKAFLVAIFAVSTVIISHAAGKDDFTKVREVTSHFHRTPSAHNAGYKLIPGLDYCFQNYGHGAMGYHFINTKLLDTTVDLLYPEAIVYAPDQNGSIQLGAVAYMVPAAAWNAENNEPPQILGHSLHLNERLEMYVLYAWIWKDNASGMFEDWNPDVSCPAPLQWDGPMRWR